MNTNEPGMILSNEFDAIRRWGFRTGLYNEGNVNTQAIKLSEEVGELSRAVLKQDKKALADAIGDIVIVLTNLSQLADLNIEHCINGAYDEIKDRKGKITNHTFEKDQDAAFEKTLKSGL